MKSKSHWACLIFAILGIWIVGCETPDSQQAGAKDSQAEGATEETMAQTLPPSADEILVSEAALAAENTGGKQASGATSESEKQEAITSGAASTPREAPAVPDEKPPKTPVQAAADLPINVETKRILEAQPSVEPSEPAKAETEPAKAETTVAAATPTDENKPRVKESPSESPFIGVVVLLPSKKNFVVVDFRSGEVPPIRSELGVYRRNMFVGSVRIAEPVRPPLASADILSGTLKRGDVVR